MTKHQATNPKQIQNPKSKILGFDASDLVLQRKPAGFTLIEVLIVAFFTVILSGSLAVNFSRSRGDLTQITGGIVSDIRQAQLLAVSGAPLGDVYPCGYGVVFEPGGYRIYAGMGDCAADDRVFGDGDETVSQVGLSARMSLTDGDVYFVPPLPTTYLNGAPGASPLAVSLRIGNAECPSSSCRTVTVNSAGQITTR